jgi:large subunit ribosomal protein L30
MATYKITRVKSAIGKTPKQRATLQHLGLRKMYSSVLREDGPELQGMLRVVQHMVTIEKVD